MKYWISYLIAAIFAAITVALTRFAEAHTVLMDMVYPYMSRVVMNALAEWSAGGGCLWQKWLTTAIICGSIFLVLICVFKWNLIQWCGWVLAAISLGVMLNTGIYELNAYASPMADDMRLEISSYTVAELNEATVYFRDRANKLAAEISRDGNGNPNFGTFEEMTIQAENGFKTMTYEKSVSVFAGSTVPVKKQEWFLEEGVSGMLLPLTGEASVNPNVPTVSMPFAISKIMAQRMCIYSDSDSDFAAFLACANNESKAFKYSAYLMAYYYCYETLAAMDSPNAQACATETNKGVSPELMRDLEACRSFYSKTPEESKKVLAEIPEKYREELENASGGENLALEAYTFSQYSNVTDLLASWYIQEFIVPKHREEEIPFDPFDPGQVDLSGIVNAPTEPPETTAPAAS